MSLASPTRAAPRTAQDARTGLVEALAAAGLAAGPVAPDSATEGAAWPQWTATEYNGHLCSPSQFTFSVYVVLGAADPRATVTQADALEARVAPELFRVGIVQTTEPVLITFGDKTTMPGIRFRVVTRP